MHGPPARRAVCARAARRAAAPGSRGSVWRANRATAGRRRTKGTAARGTDGGPAANVLDRVPTSASMRSGTLAEDRRGLVPRLTRRARVTANRPWTPNDHGPNRASCRGHCPWPRLAPGFPGKTGSPCCLVSPSPDATVHGGPRRLRRPWRLKANASVTRIAGSRFAGVPRQRFHQTNSCHSASKWASPASSGSTTRGPTRTTPPAGRGPRATALCERACISHHYLFFNVCAARLRGVSRTW
jgi:hypothetical protein